MATGGQGVIKASGAPFRSFHDGLDMANAVPPSCERALCNRRPVSGASRRGEGHAGGVVSGQRAQFDALEPVLSIRPAIYGGAETGWQT